MSQPSTEPTTTTTEPAETVEEPTEGTEEMFSRDYVESLRTEAAEARVKAKRATDLELALRDAVKASAARDILQDPAALEWSDDFADDSGLPDAEKIREAAEALAAEKPHLSRVRGDVLQGHRGEESDAGAVDLAGMLRAGA